MILKKKLLNEYGFPPTLYYCLSENHKRDKVKSKQRVLEDE